MTRFKTTFQTVTAALAALLLAPVVALFGLTLLGLAVGSTVLMSAAIAFAAHRAQRDGAPDAGAAQPGDATAA